MSEKDVELNQCYLVKGILVLCIVMYHSMVVYASRTWFANTPHTDSIFYKYFALFLNSFHIYTFTFISGYLYGHLKSEKNGYKKNIDFLYTKLKRLIIPYIFVLFTWAIPARILFFSNWKDGFVYSFLLGADPAQLWFLTMIFWVFALYNLLYRLIVKNLFLTTVLVCFAYSVGILWDFTPDYFQFFKGLQFMLYFHIGYLWRCFVGESVIHKIYQIPSILLIMCNLVLFGLCIFVSSLQHNTGIKMLDLGLTTCLHMYGAISFFLVFQRVTRLKAIKNSKLLEVISRYGMPIYLYHQQIVYVGLALILNHFTPTITVLFVFLFTMAISILLSWIMTRSKITKVLIGEKLR